MYLMKSYYYDGSKQKSNKSRPFGPWVRQEIEEIPFARTNEGTALRDMIARAQVAILNPGEDHKRFLDKSFDPELPRSSQAKFSPNVIRLDIFSSEVADLSLFDLPGVISVPESEDERYLVDLVEQLVKTYIQSKASINLLCLPMNNDSANSKAANLIQRYADKTSTLGVLTKPDLYQRTESFQQWLDILQGRKFTFGHGYFVVCNAADVKVDHATAREAESSFFSEDPWINLPLAGMADRFGTQNLATALQILLEQQIRHNLPTIRQKIGDAIMHNQAELSQIPPRLETSAVLVVAQNLSDFKHRLAALFAVSSTNNYFCKAWKAMAKDFRDVLEKTKPKMRKRTRAEEARMERLGRLSATPVTPRSDDPQQVVDLDSEPERNNTEAGKRKREGPWASCDGIGCEFYLDDVRKIILETSSSNIGELVDPKAIDHMCQQSMQHWHEPLTVLHGHVRTLVVSNIRQLAAKTFAPHRQDTRLYKTVIQKIKEVLTEVIDTHQIKGENMLQIEVQVPFTTNDAEMTRQKGLVSDLLKKARKHQRLYDLNVIDVTPRKTKVKEDALPPDQFELEIETFSDVRAYYSIAYSRFVDNICQGIQAVLFSECIKRLEAALDDLFKIHKKEGMSSPRSGRHKLLTCHTGERICEDLLAEDPNVTEWRESHEREIRRLEEAMSEVETIYSGDERSDGYSSTTNGVNGMSDLVHDIQNGYPEGM